MAHEHLDLDALGARLKSEGPFIITVDGKTYRVIGAGISSKLLEAFNNHIVAIEVDADGQPCSGRITDFNNGKLMMIAGPYRLRIKHRLTMDELLVMIRRGSKSADHRHMYQAGEWAISSIEYYDIGPDEEAVAALLHRAYGSHELWRLMGTQESLEFLCWYACGRPKQHYRRNFNLALQAVIKADGPQASAQPG